MRDPMRPINMGYMTSAIASVIGFFIVNWFYLADPKLNLLTREDFSGYIKNSPQKTRIVHLDALS